MDTSMPQMLTQDDLNALADLVERSGRASDPAQNALCKEIGVDPSKLTFLGKTAAHDFAVELVTYLQRIGDWPALVQLCNAIAPILKGQYAKQLAQIRAKLPDAADEKKVGPGTSETPDEKIRAISPTLGLLAGRLGTSVKQIDSLTDLKELHSTLHDLQFGCYKYMRSTLKSLPEHLTDVEELVDHRTLLQETEQELRKIAQRPSLCDEVQWMEWIGSLAQAVSKVDQARDTSQRAPLKEACTLVQAILKKWPLRINDRLFQAVKDLDLDGLYQNIDDVEKILRDRKLLKEDGIQVFDQAETALGGFGDTLPQLAREHNAWQEIDVDLWTIEDSLSHGIDELKDDWPPLWTRIEPLCHSEIAECQELRSYGEKLSDILKEAAPDRVSAIRAFNDFRGRASNRFYSVDKDLNENCKQLKGTGGALKDVSRVLRSFGND